MTELRRLRCGRCGAIGHAPDDGIYLLLPAGWKIVAQGSNGTPVFFCPPCIAATTLPANDEGVEP